MVFQKLRLGHFNAPANAGGQSQVQLLPTDRESGGGFTITGSKEDIMALIGELAQAGVDAPLELAVYATQPQA
jgi:hypothetical protein